MNRAGYVWGMHWLGWVFWILLAVLAAFVVVRLVSRKTSRHPSPEEVLKRQYANGEMSASEFKERKAGLKN